ncbi:MAG: response regulator [Candidatus Marinimicrobia bacterium]|nr:response regulator [Candidatus Neomarinimicrobiota bacterium]
MTNRKDKILIVEDDKASQLYYSTILNDLYDLRVVPTADQAREALQQEVFSLAIIDISLPGGEDGTSLIKWIKKEHSHNLPLVAITAHAFPQHREAALQAGAQEYFTKPILSSMLLEMIRRYIQD